MVVPRTIHPFPRCPKPARESRLPKLAYVPVRISPQAENTTNINLLFLNSDVAPVHYVAAAVKVASYGMALVIYIICLRKGVVTSGLLFFFWFLSAIFGALTFRSALSTPYVIGDQRMTPFANYAVQYPLVVALFFLCCWADAKPKYINVDGISGQACNLNEAERALPGAQPRSASHTRSDAGKQGSAQQGFF